MGTLRDMNMRALLTRTRSVVRRSALVQGGVLLTFWLIGQGIADLTDVPLPGGVIGMLLMLALLCARFIEAASVRRGADWLLGNLLLFFVPAVLAVMNHPELLGLLGVKIALIILLGTSLVMGVTASTVVLCTRWRASHGLAELPG